MNKYVVVVALGRNNEGHLCAVPLGGPAERISFHRTVRANSAAEARRIAREDYETRYPGFPIVEVRARREAAR